MSNSYMSEGEYRPQSKGASFNPVDIIDIVPAMQAEQSRQSGAERNKLNDINRNNQTKINNAQGYKNTLEALGNFSSTLQDRMVTKQKEENERAAALGEQMAYYGGTMSYDALNEQEDQLAESNSRYLKTIDAIPNAVMSNEEKELLRKDAYGHGKYGFATARLQTAVQGFPEFFSANKDNQDLAVNVNGKMVTVATAEGPEEREAAAAALRTAFFKTAGLSGINNPAVKNKYFFDPLRKMESQLLIRESEEAAKRLQATKQDTFATNLNNAPTPQSFNDYYNVLLSNGMAPGEARKEALEQLARSDNYAAINSVLDSAFGPNGKPLREQYAADVKDMLTKRNQEREQTYQLSEFERKQDERRQIKAFDEKLREDAADGTVDVTPEYLSQEATKAQLDGNTALAEHIRNAIPLTSKSQYQDSITGQIDRQLSMGIIPSVAEIQQDPMLSPETKIALINKIEAKAASTVPSDVAKGADKIIKSALDRVAGYDRVGGGKKHESLEWAIQTANSRWNSVYATELARTNDHEAAKKAADDDFKAELNDADGLYKIDASKEQGGMGIFANYNSSGKAYGFDNLQRQVQEKLKSNPQAALTSDKELYDGETASLERMELGMRNSGKLVVPQIYYDIQQGSGGKASVVDLVNSRLKGLGLDELPPEITAVTAEAEADLNSSGFNWQYRPNQVRTNIAAIGGSGEPIYNTNSVAPSESTLSAVESNFGMDTSAGPDGGRNACVYAVNKVLQAAGIETPWGNSVYVPRVKTVLDEVGIKLSGPEPGAIAIMQDNGNPPYPHIGIVDANGMIVSNSSSRAKFDWRGTPEEYKQKYGRDSIYYALPTGSNTEQQPWRQSRYVRPELQTN